MPEKKFADDMQVKLLLSACIIALDAIRHTERVDVAQMLTDELVFTVANWANETAMPDDDGAEFLYKLQRLDDDDSIFYKMGSYLVDYYRFRDDEKNVIEIFEILIEEEVMCHLRRLKNILSWH